MSKKRMGSSIDDFLKEESIFEESQALAVKEVVAWQLAPGNEEKENLEDAHGGNAQDQPSTIGPHSQSKERHYLVESAKGRSPGWAARCY